MLQNSWAKCFLFFSFYLVVMYSYTTPELADTFCDLMNEEVLFFSCSAIYSLAYGGKKNTMNYPSCLFPSS